MIVPITVKFKIERNFVADVYPQDLVCCLCICLYAPELDSLRALNELTERDIMDVNIFT